MTKIVNAWNEWARLRRVILGRPEGTQIAGPDPGLYSHQPTGGFPSGTWGMFPQEMVDAANEQMDGFAQILERRGVIVDRVEIHPAYKQVTAVSTPDWTMPNVRGANCPRDLFMTVGNEIIEGPGAQRARWYEYLNLRPLLERYFHEDPEFLWTAAPKPRLTDASYDLDYFKSYYSTWTEAEKRDRMKASRFHLSDVEPLWDAACAMRMGRDILWFHSCVSNNAGIDWLKRYFAARGLRVHEVQFGTTQSVFYSFHIDVIVCPLRPGLLVHNPERPFLTEEAVQLFRRNDWEIVEAVGPTHYYDADLDAFGVPERGYIPTYMNTLSLDERTVAVEAHELRYMDQLSNLGFEVIPVAYDKVIPFGGSLHCTTLDVYRDGGCEDHFPHQIER